MTSNNLQPAEPSREGGETESQLRDHRVIISLTAEEFGELRALIPTLEDRHERRVIPIGTAAYLVFQRGLQSEREAAAA